MSAFISGETRLTDQTALVAALLELGFPASCIEEHEVAQSLIGYHGDTRAQKGHVIVRRQGITSASNDIGFERQANGKFAAWVSEYDQRAAASVCSRRTGMQVTNVAKEIEARATIIQAERAAQAKGMKTTRSFTQNAQGQREIRLVATY